MFRCVGMNPVAPVRQGERAQRRLGDTTAEMLLLLACTQPEAVPTGPGWPLLPVTNVILVQVDTLRANHLAAYGYERDTMPRLAANHPVVVHGFASASSWTLPSVGSIFTGLEVHHHGLRTVDDGIPDSPITAPTLAEGFKDAGYATAYFSGNSTAVEDTGLHAGFDVYHFSRPQVGTSNLSQMVPHLGDWLDSVDTPFFAVLQPMDPHSPYSPMAEDRGTFVTGEVPFDEDAERDDQNAEIAALWAEGDDESRAALTQTVRDVYDEQLLGLDRAFDTLLGTLARRELRESTLVILTGDHGETLSEEGDGEFGHGGSVREELVEVPLLFFGSGLPEGDVDCLSSGFDLLPTLFGLQGIALPDDLDGQSRLGSCRETTRSGLLSELTPQLTVATQDARVSWRCGEGWEEHAWDLTVDPGALTPVDAATLPDGAALQAGLADYAEEVAAAMPTITCGGR